jgi:hypothetical protein
MGNSGPQGSILLEFERAGVTVNELTLPADSSSGTPVFECAWVNILELRILLGTPSPAVRFQISLWRDGLPLDAVPQHGWLELQVNPAE